MQGKANKCAWGELRDGGSNAWAQDRTKTDRASRRAVVSARRISALEKMSRRQTRKTRHYETLRDMLGRMSQSRPSKVRHCVTFRDMNAQITKKHFSNVTCKRPWCDIGCPTFGRRTVGREQAQRSSGNPMVSLNSCRNCAAIVHGLHLRLILNTSSTGFEMPLNRIS